MNAWLLVGSCSPYKRANLEPPAVFSALRVVPNQRATVAFISFQMPRFSSQTMSPISPFSQFEQARMNREDPPPPPLPSRSNGMQIDLSNAASATHEKPSSPLDADVSSFQEASRLGSSRASSRSRREFHDSPRSLSCVSDQTCEKPFVPSTLPHPTPSPCPPCPPPSPELPLRYAAA